MTKEIVINQLPNDDQYLTVMLNTRITFTNIPSKGWYGVQYFNLFPPSLEPYFAYTTKLKNYITKYIHDYLLFLADSNIDFCVFEKEEKYDPLNFAYYYRIIKEYDSLILKNINPKNISFLISKKNLININEIGECKTCYFSKKILNLQRCEFKSSDKIIKDIFKENKKCFFWLEKNE